MTVRQQAHQLIDNLNMNDLNYIIGILNGLNADNRVNLPVPDQEARRRARLKKQALTELEGLSLDIPEDFDPDKALAEAVEEKYGPFD